MDFYISLFKSVTTIIINVRLQDNLFLIRKKLKMFGRHILFYMNFKLSLNYKANERGLVVQPQFSPLSFATEKINKCVGVGETESCVNNHWFSRNAITF